MRNISRKLSVTAVFTGTVLAASVAFAAWTATGAGHGYAKAGTAEAVTTIDASASTSAQLYPGGSGDVKLTVSNPNDYPVKLASITGKRRHHQRQGRRLRRGHRRQLHQPDRQLHRAGQRPGHLPPCRAPSP